ncbi:innexin-3 domain protein [Teladorsagia circumcincta]|uniref:Innexin n=1 Tax=Teladorsagia circumcincta TaxID=45464 RepID=A0A2G9UY72_TELCI|nr:innexin-3 domain protein [Teladorsagia circumcincta]
MERRPGQKAMSAVEPEQFPVADSVDYLNYYVTSIMFAFFALAISAKQYFGSPIQCWVPSEFRGGWEKYAEDYCFIANSYYVPFDEEIPVDIEHRKDHISYYRWVPIMLALQAIMFFIPNWIWNMLHKQTAINPREFLKEAEKARYTVGEKRDKEIESLANYFMDTVAVFQPNVKGKGYSSPRCGYNATLLYLFTKAGYVSNICVQIIILNHFLGQNYLHWGFEMTSNIVQGNEWKETEVFPRVIMCDFQEITPVDPKEVSGELGTMKAPAKARE